MIMFGLNKPRGTVCGDEVNIPVASLSPGFEPLSTSPSLSTSYFIEIDVILAASLQCLQE
jgi:hypothetical protein